MFGKKKHSMPPPPLKKEKAKKAKKPKIPPPPKKKVKEKAKKVKKMSPPPKKKKIVAKKVKPKEPKPGLTPREKMIMKKRAKMAKKFYIEGRTIILRVNKLNYKPDKDNGFPGLQTPDYWSWPLAELKELAKELEIKGYARMSQETLIRALKKYQLKVEQKYLKNK